MDLNQIEPADCLFTLHGEKLAYLSRGKLRILAKQLGLSPDGVKLALYTRIVSRLEEDGAEAEISEGLPQKELNLRDRLQGKRRQNLVGSTMHRSQHQ